MAVDIEGCLYGCVAEPFLDYLRMYVLFKKKRGVSMPSIMQPEVLQADLQWPGFCRAIGMPELEKDARFNKMEAREQNCRELIHILDEVFASGAAEEWEKSFREHDCIYGCVATPDEVTSDPRLWPMDILPKCNTPRRER